MTKEDKDRVIKILSRLNDIIARCRYSIDEANIVIKEIKNEYTNIAFPLPHVNVIREVSDEFGVDITTKSRRTEIVDARFACAYLLKKFTPLSLDEMSEYLGVNHHTSVMHAIKTASNLMVTNIDFRVRVEKIEKILWEQHTQLYGNNLQKI